MPLPSPIRDTIPALYLPEEQAGLVTVSEAVPFDVRADASDADLRRALCAAAVAVGAQWLLAHLDDGVTWGRFEAGEGGSVVLAVARGRCAASGREAAERYSVPLRAGTLIRARVFGEGGEVRVRRSGGGFRGHRLADVGGAPATGAFEGALDLVHEVWGRWGRPLGGAFTYVDEGEAGFGHVLPLAPPPGFAADPDHPEGNGPVRAGYRVRTYLGASTAPGDTDRSGGAGLVPVAHRLVGLGWILHDTPETDG